MKKWIIIVILLGTFGALFAYRFIKLQNQPEIKGIDEIQSATGIPVRVIEVQPQNLIESIPISGALKAFVEVKITPQITERIKTIHVQTGQQVKKDDLLVTLEDDTSILSVRQADATLKEAQEQLRKLKNGTRPEELAIAQATLKQQQADYDLKKIEFERQQKLLDEEATTVQAFQQAEAAFNLSQALLAQAQAQNELAQNGAREEDIKIAETRVELSRIALDQAQEHLDDHYLKAPFDGVVTHNLFEPGDILEMNIPIFHLVDINKLYLELDVSELYLPHIKVGMDIELTVDALPGRSFIGNIDEINPIANTTSRSYLTRILINNPEDTLKPGMFGRAEIILEKLENILVLPSDAIRTENGTPYVFTVDAQQTAHKVNVVTGRIFDNLVEIKKGLNIADKVISLGTGITPETKVVITE